jgi:signal transduction histidine kinase
MKVEVFQSDANGKKIPMTIHVLDSMFGPESQKKKLVKMRREMTANLLKSLPGIQFKLYDKKIIDNEGKVLTSVSDMSSGVSASLVLENLNTVVLQKIWPYIALSFIYLLVCVSAVVLLINSIRKARRLMEQKVSFTNNMTHELKTPIATLFAATEALDKYNVLEDKKTAREYVQLMQADLKRLKNMADSILNNARLSDGKLQLHKENLNLYSILDEVVFNFRPRLEKLEAKITYGIPEGFFIKADEDHISRVFTNLIDNSLKYAIATPKINIAAVKDRSFIKITVTDNGIGIPYKYHKDIFRPYFRVFEGNRHTVKGYGLGLSYVKEVVRRHGGTIVLVKDDQLKGAAFEIIIPSGHE